MASSALAVYLHNNGRSRKLHPVICQGIDSAGDRFEELQADKYFGPQSLKHHETVVFYGYECNTPRIMKDAVAAGKTVVFVDLGYWGRRDGGRYRGYHKVAINSRHPTAYIESLYGFTAPRERRLMPKLIPWRAPGKHILLCGMSERAANAVGLDANEWELKTIERIRKVTDRPIVYRAKPSWRGASPLPHTKFDPHPTIGPALENCHIVVGRHSNACCEALILGVPAYCEDGAAYPLSIHDISQIESPIRPENRAEWLNALSWCQFSVAEIRSGFMWRTLKRQKLIR